MGDPHPLAAVTGARRSETLGLAWEDVDLKVGIIDIGRGVQRAADSAAPDGLVFTPLKTKRARRQVQLPAFALERLRQHRREQMERRSTQGAEWRDPLDEAGIGSWLFVIAAMASWSIPIRSRMPSSGWRERQDCIQRRAFTTCVTRWPPNSVGEVFMR